MIVEHMKDGKTLIPVWAFQINEKPLNDSEYQYESTIPSKYSITDCITASKFNKDSLSFIDV